MAPIQGGIIHIIIWSRGVSTTQRKGGFGCVRDPGDPREELATVTSKIWLDKEGKKGNQPAGLREGLGPQLGGRKSWERGTQAGGSGSRGLGSWRGGGHRAQGGASWPAGGSGAVKKLRVQKGWGLVSIHTGLVRRLRKDQTQTFWDSGPQSSWQTQAREQKHPEYQGG